jgi:hypothetical protein
MKKRFRALASQSPAIVISVVALTFSLGGGAGYAASVATSHPATKITWHKLGLMNGWHAAVADGFKGEGVPALTVSNGVVYLTGVARRAANSASLPAIAILPKGDRPRHYLWFPAFNYAANGESSIEIQPTGKIIVLGNGDDENYFTSLAGIEFPLGS